MAESTIFAVALLCVKNTHTTSYIKVPAEKVGLQVNFGIFFPNSRLKRGNPHSRFLRGMWKEGSIIAFVAVETTDFQNTCTSDIAWFDLILLFLHGCY